MYPVLSHMHVSNVFLRASHMLLLSSCVWNIYPGTNLAHVSHFLTYNTSLWYICSYYCIHRMPLDLLPKELLPYLSFILGCWSRMTSLSGVSDFCLIRSSKGSLWNLKLDITGLLSLYCILMLYIGIHNCHCNILNECNLFFPFHSSKIVFFSGSVTIAPVHCFAIESFCIPSPKSYMVFWA
jgi:hypothetical protein